jgi:peptide/nickel transport system permease protein
MIEYIIRRLLLIIPTALGVSIIVFGLVHLIPGDPAQSLVGAWASKESIEKLREDMGLDRPLPVQYYTWFRNVLSGDFGTSIITKEPVLTRILSKFPATLELTFFSIFFSLIVGILLGILSAVYRGSIIDISATVVSVLGMSIPVFWSALMLLFILGLLLRILPMSGRIDLDVNLTIVTNFYIIDSIITGNMAALKSTLAHLLLPTIAMMNLAVADITRMTRSSLLEVLRMDYINTARAKGLRENMVICKHALRNALIPVVTVAGLRFGAQLAGAVFVETIFARPGLGRVGYKAILSRDYPMIQGVILFVCLMFMVLNLFVDILYSYVNPRIRY